MDLSGISSIYRDSTAVHPGSVQSPYIAEECRCRHVSGRPNLGLGWRGRIWRSTSEIGQIRTEIDGISAGHRRCPKSGRRRSRVQVALGRARSCLATCAPQVHAGRTAVWSRLKFRIGRAQRGHPGACRQRSAARQSSGSGSSSHLVRTCAETDAAASQLWRANRGSGHADRSVTRAPPGSRSVRTLRRGGARELRRRDSVCGLHVQQRLLCFCSVPGNFLNFFAAVCGSGGVVANSQPKSEPTQPTCSKHATPPYLGVTRRAACYCCVCMCV